MTKAGPSLMGPLSSLLSGNVPLALAAALTWGGGDFTGGMGVKRAGGTLPSALRVVLLSHAASLLVLLLLILFRHDPLPAGTPLRWGLAAGLFGGLSVVTFYICLARGAMGASAAISGLLAAAIPAAASILLEGPPGPTRIAGFLIAAASIWLIAASAAPSPSVAPAPSLSSTAASGTVLLSIASGVGFGLYFVDLRMAGAAGLVWPLALSRSVSISVCLLGILLMLLRNAKSAMSTHIWSRPVVAWALATAVLDTAGNLFFIAATRAGRLDVAAVLASLYPASTILLAVWILRERLSARQGLGMALAAAAVVLITL